MFTKAQAMHMLLSTESLPSIDMLYNEQLPTDESSNMEDAILTALELKNSGQWEAALNESDEQENIVLKKAKLTKRKKKTRNTN